MAKTARSCQCRLPPHAVHPAATRATGGTPKNSVRATRADVSCAIGTISGAPPTGALIAEGDGDMTTSEVLVSPGSQVVLPAQAWADLATIALRELRYSPGQGPNGHRVTRR